MDMDVDLSDDESRILDELAADGPPEDFNPITKHFEARSAHDDAPGAVIAEANQYDLESDDEDEVTDEEDDDEYQSSLNPSTIDSLVASLNLAFNTVDRVKMAKQRMEESRNDQKDVAEERESDSFVKQNEDEIRKNDEENLRALEVDEERVNVLLILVDLPLIMLT